ncbi:MAG: AraC family transcriptional regulator [Flavobacteriaceae bacterium]
MPQIINDLQTGELAFGLEHFECLSQFKNAQRKNYYSIILLNGNNTKLFVDFSEYTLEGKHMICLSPYQVFTISSDENCSGIQLDFHPDFYCTYRHQNEIETEGVLFGKFHSLPFFKISNEALFYKFIDLISKEMNRDSVAQHEVLVAYLKIFLIEAVRQKREFDKNSEFNFFCRQTEVLQSLIDAINNHYTDKHSPQDYADLLCTSTKTLAGLSKKYLNQTLTSLIANRILIEAKRELYLTPKPVKQIAAALGYMDEFYFSRFFKKRVGVSPDIYRKTVGFDKLSTL